MIVHIALVRTDSADVPDVHVGATEEILWRRIADFYSDQLADGESVREFAEDRGVDLLTVDAGEP